MPLSSREKPFLTSSFSAISGAIGCGHVACWLRIHTTAGRAISVGASAPEYAGAGPPREKPDVEGGFLLTPRRGFGVFGIADADADGHPELLQHDCAAMPPPCWLLSVSFGLR